MQKRASIHSPSNKKRVALGAREKKRVLQLVLCLVLFLIALTGKGVSPDTWEDAGERMLHLIRTNTDFNRLLQNLNKEIILREEMSEKQTVYESDDEKGIEVLGNESTQREEPSTTEKRSSASKITVPAYTYTGPALPAGATMEYVELGLAETVAPVNGRVTSSFGYRDHPVDGEHSFHSGVDIAADTGTPVSAFAAGTVDFIGESDAYGLYMQLNHGGGITTFYCHCSELLVPKGAQVSVGETIAKVGNSGNATGSHLHMELRQNEVLLNPLYYFEAAV